mgnify:CR=1 FL=1
MEKKYLEYTALMSVYFKENPQWLKLSIESMLNQTVRPQEFILVKDGPLTVELDEVINTFVNTNPGLFNVITNEKNMGLGLALAEGVKAAKNELIARIDSDDYIDSTRCEKQLEKFQEDPELGIVGCYEAEFIENIDNVISVHRVPSNNDDIKKFMRRRCAILHPTVMYKRSLVLKSGNYKQVFLYEDYDLFARMVFEYHVKSYNIPEALYYIRTSEDFFRRRGGIKYAKTVLGFKWRQFRKGYMSSTDFCVSGLGQAVVCVLPNSLRKSFYMCFLRK